MSSKKVYIATFLTVLFLQLNAQNYTGTIGKHQVYFYLEHYKNDFIEANYFYIKYLKDIPLRAEFKNQQYFLESNPYATDDEIETFVLEKKGDGLVGTWQKNNQKLAVNLKPIQLDLQAFKQDQLYLKRDSITSHGKKELVWFTEHYSGESSFRLGNGFTKAQREKFNPILDTLQYKSAFWNLSCQAYDFATDIKLVNGKYLSYQIIGSSYCGGAHPYYGIATHNFDLENLKEITSIQELYPNFQLIRAIREKFSDDEDLQKECNYFDNASVWQYVQFYLSPTGAVFIPDYPHAGTPCEVEFPFTYAELESYQ